MLFRDDALNRELDDAGVVTVDLFEGDELEQLRGLYDEMHPGGELPHKVNGIHMTSWCPDPEYKRQVASRMREIFTSPCAARFHDHRTLNHVFIVKDPGAHTEFCVHQDWSVVDENRYRSVNIWVPLYDVSEDTGALWIVKGSHRINRSIRGAGCLFPNYRGVMDYLRTKATSMNAPAGKAIVFYHSVIHGSPPNQGKRVRAAAALSVVPQQAPLHIYFQKDTDSPLEVHHPADDFMFQYTNLTEETTYIPPTPKAAETHPSFRPTAITQDELESVLG